MVYPRSGGYRGGSWGDRWGWFDIESNNLNVGEHQDIKNNVERFDHPRKFDLIPPVNLDGSFYGDAH